MLSHEAVSLLHLEQRSTASQFDVFEKNCSCLHAIWYLLSDAHLPSQMMARVHELLKSEPSGYCHFCFAQC
jgi:hypothetical protein